MGTRDSFPGSRTAGVCRSGRGGKKKRIPAPGGNWTSVVHSAAWLSRLRVKCDPTQPVLDEVQCSSYFLLRVEQTPNVTMDQKNFQTSARDSNDIKFHFWWNLIRVEKNGSPRKVHFPTVLYKMTPRNIKWRHHVCRKSAGRVLDFTYTERREIWEDVTRNGRSSFWIFGTYQKIRKSHNYVTDIIISHVLSPLWYRSYEY